MAIALNITQKEYILECDKDLSSDKQTKFFIKPLSARQAAVMQDSISLVDGKASISNMGTYTLDVLKAGLTGWENFVDESGNQIKFTKNMDENIDRIPMEYRYEISSEIMNLSTLGESKLKN